MSEIETGRELLMKGSIDEQSRALLESAARWIRGDHGYRVDERGCRNLVARIETHLSDPIPSVATECVRTMRIELEDLRRTVGLSAHVQSDPLVAQGLDQRLQSLIEHSLVIRDR